MSAPSPIPRPEPPPAPPTPTPEPGALYGVLLGATAAASRRREPVPRAEVPVLAAATFALSKLVVHEKVETWLRQPFVEERGDAKKPKGRRLRYAVGELLTCTRCTGAWSALGLGARRLSAPEPGRRGATVLAASAGSDMLQSGFSWLCAGANTRRQDAELTGRRLSSAA